LLSYKEASGLMPPLDREFIRLLVANRVKWLLNNLAMKQWSLPHLKYKK
jgi:hypothetical protein